MPQPALPGEVEQRTSQHMDVIGRLASLTITILKTFDEQMAPACSGHPTKRPIASLMAPIAKASKLVPPVAP